METAPTPLNLNPELLPVISYAMQQNGASLIRSVTIENPTDAPMEHLELDITSDPGFSLPFTDRKSVV